MFSVDSLAKEFSQKAAFPIKTMYVSVVKASEPLYFKESPLFLHKMFQKISEPYLFFKPLVHSSKNDVFFISEP